MNAPSQNEDRVPDIKFERLMTSDDVVDFIRDRLDGTIMTLKMVLLFAAMDRATMVKAIDSLGEEEAISSIECVETFSQWLKEMALIADAVFHRSIVAVAEITDMLKPMEIQA